MTFTFPSGKQSDFMPSPGKGFTGGSKIGHLPDNKEGNAVLVRMIAAFETGKVRLNRGTHGDRG